jgi:hypothetical protein
MHAWMNEGRKFVLTRAGGGGYLFLENERGALRGNIVDYEDIYIYIHMMITRSAVSCLWTAPRS